MVGVQRIADALPRRSIDVPFRRGAEFVTAFHLIEAMWLHALHAVVLCADDDSVPAEAHLVNRIVLRDFRIREKPVVEAEGMHRSLHVVVVVRSSDAVLQRWNGHIS